MENEPEIPPARPRYRWPWFALAGLLLGIVLAIVWMSFAVKRTRELRESNPLPVGNEPAR